ncbi:hypothetical protein ACFXPW_24010, partial [Streptomyces goshikiensis]
MIPRRFIPAAIGVVVATAVATAVFLPSATATSANAPHAADKATVDAFGRIADDVLSTRTQALVEDRPKHRAPTAGSGAVKTRMSSEVARGEETAVSSLRSRKTRLRDLGEAYSDADTRVTVDKATVTNGKATVQVTEETTLTYKKLRGDEPSSTGFRTRYEMNLVSKRGGNWELTSIKSQENGPVAVKGAPRGPAPRGPGASPTHPPPPPPPAPDPPPRE